MIIFLLFFFPEPDTLRAPPRRAPPRHAPPRPAPPRLQTVLAYLALAAAVTVAAPQPNKSPVVVNLLSDEREHAVDGTFRYSFSADNGINTSVTGTRGAEGAITMEGTYW